MQTRSQSRSPAASAPRTRQAWQAPREEVAEGLPRHVVVCAAAVNEVHGHIQYVLHVPLKPKARLKHKGQRAAAAGAAESGQWGEAEASVGAEEAW